MNIMITYICYQYIIITVIIIYIIYILIIIIRTNINTPSKNIRLIWIDILQFRNWLKNGEKRNFTPGIFFLKNWKVLWGGSVCAAEAHRFTRYREYVADFPRHFPLDTNLFTIPLHVSLVGKMMLCSDLSRAPAWPPL